MIARFFHADRGVSETLARAVASMPRLLLVTQLQGARELPVETLSPFREVLAAAGDRLDLAVVIDEGKPDGMWRDPFGDLCTQLFPDRTAASSATRGLILTLHGRALTWFERSLWDPQEDAEAITAYLAKLDPEIRPYRRQTTRPVGPPGSGRRPAARPQSSTSRPRPRPRPAPPPEPEPLAPEELDPPPLDPFKTLGIAPGVTFEEAKQAYRRLILRCHPDKVASLGPEIRAAAEQRTRELNVAFGMLEKALGRKKA